MKPFFFISMFIIYVAANGYVLARIFKNVLNGSPLLKAACTLLFGLMILCLVIFFAIRDIEIPLQLQRIIYLNHPQSNSMETMIADLILSSLKAHRLTETVYALFDIAKLVMPSFKYGTHCAICLTAFILALGYKNYQKPEVCRIEIQTDKKLTVDGLVGSGTRSALKSSL